MISVTVAAIAKLKAIQVNHPEDPVVGISVRDVDHARVSFSITLEAAAHPDDLVQEVDSFTIAVDRLSTARMEGVTVPSDLGEKINIKDLVVQPLMNVLEDKCKIKIVSGSQVIGATLAERRVASLLEVMAGFPLLKIERVAFDTRKRPVEYISILYRSDRYHFNVDFTRKRSESKAQWDYTGP